MRTSRGMVQVRRQHSVASVMTKMAAKWGRGATPSGATMEPMMQPATPPRLHMPWKVAMMLRP